MSVGLIKFRHPDTLSARNALVLLEPSSSPSISQMIASDLYIQHENRHYELSLRSYSVNFTGSMVSDRWGCKLLEVYSE